MNELIQQLVAKTGITEAQAAQATMVTKDFLKTKLPPQMAGMVESFFAGNFDAAGAAAAQPDAKSADWADQVKETAADAGNRLGAFAGQAKDKAEDLAQDATRLAGEWAGKAEDIAGEALDKIKGFFASDKKDERKF